MESNRLQRELERQRSAGAAGLIDLSDTNFHENGMRFPEEVLEPVLLRYLGVRSYHPDAKGDPAAREAIARFYRDQGIHVEPNRIFITASTSESYSLLFSALARAGDNVVLPSPTYPLFEYLVDFARLEPRYYTMEFERGFCLEPQALLSQIDDRTRFVVLISPNNPTGRVADRAEVGRFVETCNESGTMIIADEVFSEMLYGDSDGPVPQLARPAAIRTGFPVFTLNGISKMFASPDLKLAWIAVSGDAPAQGELLERLELANDTFLSCSSLTQYLLPSLFEHKRELTAAMTSRMRANRTQLLDSLGAEPNTDALGPTGFPTDGKPVECRKGIRLVPPNGGIHCVLGIPRSKRRRWADDENFAVELLGEKKLYVHPGYFYGIEEREDELYVVVSFLKERESLAEGLERLVSFV